jgi:hypothetical protein
LVQIYTDFIRLKEKTSIIVIEILIERNAKFNTLSEVLKEEGGSLMLRSMLRVFFALAVGLSLALGVFSGVGTTPALAASQTPVASGYNPVSSDPTDISYCYQSGYNRNGWRCGWRLAMAPYNLGDYYGYYNGYYNGYGYGYTGYGYGYNSGQCPPGYNGDYGGRPRYGCYYPYYPYNQYNPYPPYYNPPY